MVEKRACYLLIDEALRSTERRTSGRIALSYPDAERESYRADLSGKDLRFASRSGRCAFSLARPRRR